MREACREATHIFQIGRIRRIWECVAPFSSFVSLLPHPEANIEAKGTTFMCVKLLARNFKLKEVFGLSTLV